MIYFATTAGHFCVAADFVANVICAGVPFIVALSLVLIAGGEDASG